MLGQLHHVLEILLGETQWQTAQRVVRTKLENEDAGLMQLQRPGQTLQTAACRFAADAGVNDPVSVTLRL